MPNGHDSPHGRDRAEDSPVAWFVMLELALHRSDFELAAKARRELERLGVKVRIIHRRPYVKKGGSNAD